MPTRGCGISRCGAEYCAAAWNIDARCRQIEMRRGQMEIEARNTEMRCGISICGAVTRRVGGVRCESGAVWHEDRDVREMRRGISSCGATTAISAGYRSVSGDRRLAWVG